MFTAGIFVALPYVLLLIMPETYCELAGALWWQVVSRTGEEYDARLTRLANGAQSREEAR